jgi:hypothetical protein
MDYNIYIEWIKFHMIEIAFIALLLFFAIRHFIKKRKKKEVKEEPIKEEPKVQEDIDLDTIGKFLDIGLVENNNVEHLKSLKKDTREEINTLNEQYKKAGEEFKSLLVLEKRLKIHIQTLIQQEVMYENQISRLSKEKVTGGVK